MATIETALVSNGNLLIQLDDGTIVNAGRVAGPQGQQGLPGAEGPRGADGRNGQDGAAGAQWHTGIGAPELSLGNNGDLYMDVAASTLPIFQKINGEWIFLANLKAHTGGGVSGGNDGGAGGGGSVIIYPGPIPPTSDNSGGGIDKGDIWLDTETGWLWIYNGSVWLPVADRPPVIISQDPPDYNNAADGNALYVVKEGDLWFDSDQLATYVAVKNIADELVWVITTPHNREGLASTIPSVRDIPIYVFPRAVDQQIEYNSTTDTEYIYNAAKNQWIDLSQMVHYGTTPPAHAPTGAVFTDEESLKQFIQVSQGIWVEQTSCGAGPGGSISGNLTAINFTGYECRSYQGTPFSDRTILTEIYWETQEGIHFEDEITVEVDMNNTDTWEDAHLMDQATLDGYDIAIVFNKISGALAFNFDWKGTNEGPWDPHPNYPCARMRVTVKNQNLENPSDFTLKSSEPTYVFPEYNQYPHAPTPLPAHPGASC